jgi:magnesium chelatase subunit I
VDHGLSITRQESWTDRNSPARLEVPNYIREIVEQLAFLAREDKKVDKRSGVSQRLPISVLENVASNAERRALRAGETVAVPRVLDIYSALPSITGKLELEYEGELKGGDNVARELIRAAVGKVYTSHFDGVNVSQIVQWFELGGSLKLDESLDSSAMAAQLTNIQGLMEKTGALGLGASEPDALRASAAEFILEGLYAHRRISRNEEIGFTAGERKREAAAGEREEGRPRPPRRQFN